MNEMMMGGSARVYPWSGPGSKKLKAGTRDLGYFGEVTQKELFDHSLVWAMVNPPNGNKLFYSDNVWLKFILDGRILYISKYQMASAIRWTDLYAAGAVYGKRGSGDLPVPAAGAVDQFKLVTKIETINGKPKTWPLKLQLADGANLYGNTTGDFPSDQSDWDRIWTAFFDKKWETYSWQTMNVGNTNAHTVIKERSGDGNYFATRGGGNAVLGKSYGSITGTPTTNVLWRPVLELLTDQNTALEVYEPNFFVSGGMKNSFPKLDDDGTPPVKSPINIQAYSSHQRGVQPVMETKSEQVYLLPSTGDIVLTADFTPQAELVGLRNVTLRNSAMAVPQPVVQTGREEVFVNVPGATVTLAAVTETVDAGLVSPQRLVAIRTAQSPIKDYKTKGYEPTLSFANNAQQNSPTPTFTIEADGS